LQISLVRAKQRRLNPQSNDGAPMPQLLTPDICVIGAGPGGLAAAAEAAAYGVRTVLIERGAMGGQSLYTGAVPAKAMMAAAKRVQNIKTAWNFGVRAADLSVNHRAVAEHIQSVIEGLKPQVSAERYNGLGADTIKASARFIDKDTVLAGDYEIKARRFIIATGSSPLIPPIPGLDRVPYFTTSTIFENSHRLPHLIVAGGGSIGLELAQAHRRLGSEVTVIETGRVISRDDPELGDYLLKCLRDEGIRVLENARLERIEPFGNNIQAVFAMLGKSYSVEASHLLLSMGRAPATADLNLDAAGIKYSERGIQVSKSLCTSNRKVYAIGDVTGESDLAHAARHHASVAVKNALFLFPTHAQHGTMPWVTFTDPEVAHVGLTEETARDRFGRLQILRWPYRDNFRAQAERKTGGFVKVIASRSGRILGAGIVGAEAGELIQMWSLAMQKDIPLSAMASIVSPHPTLAEVNKAAAEYFFAPRAQSPLIRRAIALLAKIG
jgi:pyruvate/2-oxoglutarate dehydrogenase complex dihydrolipoamide dehydrogenase (E3) component